MKVLASAIVRNHQRLATHRCARAALRPVHKPVDFFQSIIMVALDPIGPVFRAEVAEIDLPGRSSALYPTHQGYRDPINPRSGG